MKHKTRSCFVSTVTVLLMVLFLFSALMATVYAWNDRTQHATGEFSGTVQSRGVILNKYEKDNDGSVTGNTIPGAEFYLYRTTEPEDIQIGGRYVTDGQGQITVENLSPGEYYFLETDPTYGYTFDSDENGEPVYRYYFTVTGKENGSMVSVDAYNNRLHPGLSLNKTVENADGTPLSKQQKEKQFAFTVQFSDDGTYQYKIGDGKAETIKSGDTVYLRHSETLVIVGLPVNTTYRITEQPEEGVHITSTGSTGTILAEGAEAKFINIYSEEHAYAPMEIIKRIEGETIDLTQDFTFTVTFSDGGTYAYRIDGGEEQFLKSGGTLILRHGQKAVFGHLPVGVAYRAEEVVDGLEDYHAAVDSFEGIVTGNGVLLEFINYYGDREPDTNGILEITKEIDSDTIDPDAEFAFEVIFGDNGSYSYRIDSGEAKLLENDGVIYLKHGQTAQFEDLPDKLAYTVREQNHEGYLAMITQAEGAIAGGSSIVLRFVNYQDAEPEKQNGTLEIIKEMEGEYPDTDTKKAFSFTLTADGKPYDFKLKPGEMTQFTFPKGTRYELVEHLDTADGYYLVKLKNGTGTVTEGRITVTATNRYMHPMMVRISGEKTWSIPDGVKVPLPDSILVSLKRGRVLIEQKTVTPDRNGKWAYTFEAPKYLPDGVTEAEYHIEEDPVYGYETEVQGYDIINTYIPPAEAVLPTVRKQITGETPTEKSEFTFLLKASNGAPLPDGSQGGSKTVSVTGEGTAQFEKLQFYETGTYYYTLQEIRGAEAGYGYDSRVYSIVVKVVERGGRLVAKSVICTDTSVGTRADEALFVNEYSKDLSAGETIVIQGSKTWNHGENDTAAYPKSITVSVIREGQIVLSKEITEAQHWSWQFVLPRYDNSGREVKYTIEEEKVPGYGRYIDGYNITNTYGAADGSLSAPQTSDSSARIWMLIALGSGLCLAGSILLNKKTKRDK